MNQLPDAQTISTAEPCILGDYDNHGDHIHRCQLTYSAEQPHRPCVCHCGTAWGP